MTAAGGKGRRRLIILSTTPTGNDRAAHLVQVIDRIVKVWGRDFDCELITSDGVVLPDSLFVACHYKIKARRLGYVLATLACLGRLQLSNKCLVMNLSDHFWCFPFFLFARIFQALPIMRVSGGAVLFEPKKARRLAFRAGFKALLQRLSSSSSSGVVCVSSELAAAVRSTHKNAFIQVIPQGLLLGEGRPYREKSRSTVDVVFVGRLEPVKRIDLIVSVMQALLSQMPDLRCVVVGNGSQSSRLDPVQGSITWHKALPHNQVIELLSQSKVLLLSSEREGLPNVALEALSCGAVVVGSSIPPLRQLSAQTPLCLCFDFDAPIENARELWGSWSEIRTSKNISASRSTILRLYGPSTATELFNGFIARLSAGSAI